MRVPPRATLTTWAPRQTPSTGMPPVERRVDQRQLEGVPAGVDAVDLGVGLGAVAGGVDVAAAAEQQAVEAVEHGGRRRRGRATGSTNGHAAGLDHGVDVGARERLDRTARRARPGESVMPIRGRHGPPTVRARRFASVSAVETSR